MEEKKEKQLENDLRQRTNDVTLPDSLKPEAIQEMLDERQEEKAKKQKESKKRKWKRILPVAAAACICLVAGLTATALTSKEDQIETAQSLTTAQSYKEIKKCINAYEKQQAKMTSSMARETAFMTESAAAVADSAQQEGSNQSDSAGYSDTNVREEGVAEADIVKTDGKNLYSLCQSTVTITALDNGLMEKLVVIRQDADRYVEEMYLQDDKLVLLGTKGTQVGDAEDGGYYENNTYVQVYDVSDPSNPQEISTLTQSGGYNTARIKDGYVYVLSNFHPYEDNVTARDPWYIPEVQGKALDAEKIYMPNEKTGNDYTVITAFSLEDPEQKTDSKAVFGYSGICYVSQDNIYITSNYYEDADTTRTLIEKVSYQDGKLEGVGQTKIKGYLNDSFSIDEYNGYLRLVTTLDSVASNDDVVPLLENTEETVQIEDGGMEGSNSLYVLDENLKIVGSIHDLAQGEQVYSARFLGDTGYFVTYRQMDPLFSVDLSDPENPAVLGTLKIPGFSEYLHPYGEGKLLGIGMDVSEDGMTTEGVKLSMFDTSDPANVTEESKYTIEETYGTNAGYNYKGVFVDVEKNLFGFTTYHDGVTYKVFTYDENGVFREVLSRQMSGYESCRALYVDDVLYLVSGNTIESYTLNGFEKISDIVL